MYFSTGPVMVLVPDMITTGHSVTSQPRYVWQTLSCKVPNNDLVVMSNKLIMGHYLAPSRLLIPFRRDDQNQW